MLWLLTGIINQCDVNPGGTAITLGQVVGANLVVSWVTVTIFIPKHFTSSAGLMRPVAHFYKASSNSNLNHTPAATVQ